MSYDENIKKKHKKEWNLLYLIVHIPNKKNIKFDEIKKK
jgi:hypothetical protein